MTYTVSSISEFTKIICELDGTLIKNNIMKNEVLLFRGQPDINYELMPSIGRHRQSAFDISLLNQERNLIEMAKFKMPEIFQAQEQPIELLALLQHHGIPTRLLDITENALVALYFACASSPEKDGEVIAFRCDDKDVTNYPVVNAIADSYRFSRGTIHSLELFFGAVKDQPYFLEQKQTHEICHDTNEKGGQWIRECCEEPIFVYAPIRSVRQQMQQGRYILFPNQIIDYGNVGAFTTLIDPIAKDDKCIAGLITIPGLQKQKMLQDLKLFGISRETLFADNIDAVCNEILRKFDRRS